MRFSLIVLVGILDQEKRRAFGFGPRLEDRVCSNRLWVSIKKLRSWSKLVGSAKLLVPKLILFRPGDRRSFCFEMGTQETLCFCLECDYCLIYCRAELHEVETSSVHVLLEKKRFIFLYEDQFHYHSKWSCSSIFFYHLCPLLRKESSPFLVIKSSPNGYNFLRPQMTKQWQRPALFHLPQKIS